MGKLLTTLKIMSWLFLLGWLILFLFTGGISSYGNYEFAIWMFITILAIVISLILFGLVKLAQYIKNKKQTKSGNWLFGIILALILISTIRLDYLFYTSSSSSLSGVIVWNAPLIYFALFLSLILVFLNKED